MKTIIRRSFLVMLYALLGTLLPLSTTASEYTLKRIEIDLQPVSSECSPPRFSGTKITTQAETKCAVRIAEKVRNLLKAARACNQGAISSETCKVMVGQLQLLAPTYDRILQSMGRSSDLANRLETFDIETYFETERGESSAQIQHEVRIFERSSEGD